MITLLLLPMAIYGGSRKVYCGGFYETVITPEITKLSDLKRDKEHIWIIQPGCYIMRAKLLDPKTGCRIKMAMYDSEDKGLVPDHPDEVSGHEAVAGIPYLYINIKKWEARHGGMRWTEPRAGGRFGGVKIVKEAKLIRKEDE